MIKLFCDPCGTEIQNTETRAELTGLEVKILENGNQPVQTQRLLCRVCYKKTLDLLQEQQAVREATKKNG